MSAMSPTARSLAECRRRGWTAQVVEQTVPHTFIKRDLFGCIDIEAITETHILGIQVTSGANHASRVAKALAEPRLRLWLARGALFEVWSYAKQGKKGSRKRWTLRVERITPDRFECATSEMASSGRAV